MNTVHGQHARILAAPPVSLYSRSSASSVWRKERPNAETAGSRGGRRDKIARLRRAIRAQAVKQRQIRESRKYFLCGTAHHSACPVLSLAFFNLLWRCRRGGDQSHRCSRRERAR